jgi:hypothetical protein
VTDQAKPKPVMVAVDPELYELHPPWTQAMTGHATYYVGDTRDVTATLPDASVDLVLTSPPFLALRSYLPADHPHKHHEIGSEPTPADFIDVLLDLVESWRRILAGHGSIVIELGDTYSGSGGAGGDYRPGGLRDGQPGADGSAKRGRLATYADARGNPDGMRDTTFQGGNTRSGGGLGWPLAKSLVGIPHLFHLSLSYGRNILRPERTIEPWRVRNVIAWCRPNPPVGALGDKFRPGTSYLTVATIAKDRWFDLDAVRTGPQRGTPGQPRGSSAKGMRSIRDGGEPRLGADVASNPAGAPPLDWWAIPTQPYKGSHYATWPEKLLDRPILAMCPERVCTTCGLPSRRIVGKAEYVPSATNRGGALIADTTRVGDQGSHINQHVGENGAGKASVIRSAPTLGWSDCGHDTWRNGMVLDPFAGTGTTLKVATGHGRDAIGIDFDVRNVALAERRVGRALREIIL